MIFALEPLKDCWDAIYAKPDGLAYQHWMETQQYRHDQPYAPSFDRYNQYAIAGWFLQFTVRDEGRLVGYAGVYMVPSMHTQQMVSMEDTWYLAPAYRKGWNAIKFYRYMENVCRDLGAVEATLTLPVSKDLGPILERLDYQKISEQYSKNLHRADSANAPNVTAVEKEKAHVCTIASAPA